MTLHIKFTDEQLLRMKEMYEAGSNTTAISKKYGICRIAVTLRLRQMGLEIRQRSYPSRATPELIDRVKWLRTLGVRWKDIEKETGLTEGYLHELLRREKAKEK